MTFVIDEAYLPATLTAPPMTDEEFAEFCSAYPDYFIEVTAEGEILIMPPNFPITGSQNQMINIQLGNWALRDRNGTITDSSSGFLLPNGARRSPDAAWIRKSRILALDTAKRNSFWHFCPDFVIELRSKTDRLPTLRRKMQEWIANGAQLGWLIDPERQAVEIYRPDCEPEMLLNPQQVAGEGPVQGFTLDLKLVWDPLA